MPYEKNACGMRRLSLALLLLPPLLLLLLLLAPRVASESAACPGFIEGCNPDLNTCQVRGSRCVCVSE
jgi:hypothetical protein